MKHRSQIRSTELHYLSGDYVRQDPQQNQPSETRSQANGHHPEGASIKILRMDWGGGGNGQEDVPEAAAVLDRRQRLEQRRSVWFRHYTEQPHTTSSVEENNVHLTK